MGKLLRQVFASIFVITSCLWITFVIATYYFPGSDFAQGLNLILRLQPEDWIFGGNFYNIQLIAQLIVICGLLMVFGGKSLWQKYFMVAIFALPREQNYWGRVLDKKLRAPIAFASVRVMETTGGKDKFVAQSVADVNGRYRLYLTSPSPNYVLEAVAPGYKKVREKLTKSMLQSNRAVRVNIMLEKENETVRINFIESFLIRYKNAITKIFTALILIMSFINTTHAIYSLIFHFGLVSIVNLVVYGLVFPWNMLVLMEKGQFNPGRVRNYETDLPISAATIRVFLPSGSTISVLSDKDGVAKFDIEAGEYKMQVSKQGFVAKSEGEKLFSLHVGKEGYLKSDIYLIASSRSSIHQNALLANPFGS